MFRKMPFVLMAVIAVVLLSSPMLSLPIKQFLYATSLTMKSIIVMLLPLIIFGLLFKTMVGLAERATAVIALILICVCCSNTLSTFLSHYVGMWVYQFNLSLIVPNTAEGLTPAWTWQFPKLVANDKAMLWGIVLGIVLGRVAKSFASHVAHRLDRVIGRLLTSFIYVIPFFIAGFMVKLQHDGVVYTIFRDYTLIFAVIAVAQFGYIFLAYLVLNRFNVFSALAQMRNMLPAGIAGFSAMSSAAAMPFTMMGVMQNTKHKDIARSVVPATVNIHLIGDCFAIPIFAYAVMKSFGMAEPALMTYLVFVFYFVVAKFSVAAIPGGGIIVMLPILESCLGFNGEMLSLMTALYILFDPVITCANVFGNGAFACLIDKLLMLGAKQEASFAKAADGA